jgi:L-lactate utilization protein LutC
MSSADDDRARFMARVRAALGRNDAPAPLTQLESLGDMVRLTHNGPRIVETFVSRAAAGGMTVHRIAHGTHWTTVLEILRAARARRIVMDTPDIDFTTARERFKAAGLTIVDPGPGAGMDAAFDVDAGITDVVAAVAETGSIMVASGLGRNRAAFIVPPVHIAVVREDQIVPDLLDLWPTSAAPPTAMTVVSGPSKTADIEGILITGVHGPGQVHVVLEAGALAP